MKGNVKQVVVVMAAIVAMGLVFRYAGNMPVISDARWGFQGAL